MANVEVYHNQSNHTISCISEYSLTFRNTIEVYHENFGVIERDLPLSDQNDFIFCEITTDTSITHFSYMANNPECCAMENRIRGSILNNDSIRKRSREQNHYEKEKIREIFEKHSHDFGIRPLFYSNYFISDYKNDDHSSKLKDWIKNSRYMVNTSSPSKKILNYEGYFPELLLKEDLSEIDLSRFGAFPLLSSSITQTEQFVLGKKKRKDTTPQSILKDIIRVQILHDYFESANKGEFCEGRTDEHLWHLASIIKQELHEYNINMAIEQIYLKSLYFFIEIPMNGFIHEVRTLGSLLKLLKKSCNDNFIFQRADGLTDCYCGIDCWIRDQSSGIIIGALQIKSASDFRNDPEKDKRIAIAKHKTTSFENTYGIPCLVVYAKNTSQPQIYNERNVMDFFSSLKSANHLGNPQDTVYNK